MDIINLLITIIVVIILVIVIFWLLHHMGGLFIAPVGIAQHIMYSDTGGGLLSHMPTVYTT